MSIQNTIALLEWYRPRNVAAVRTPSGIVFMGVRNLKPNEKKAYWQFLRVSWMQLSGGRNDPIRKI
jgi:hypothetical protein